MRKGHFSNLLGCFFVTALCAFQAFAETTIDIQRIFAVGYRTMAPSGEMSQLYSLGDGLEVSVTPSTGIVFAQPSTMDANQNRFKAKVPFGWKIKQWMRRYGANRLGGEVIEGSEGMSEIVIPWDGLDTTIDLILIIEEDTSRKITFGKSAFGEGTIGHELGTFNCVKGDAFDLNAIPAYDDANQVSLSTFLGWNDGVTAAKRTVVVNTNETYVARFEPASWTVKFDATGGDVKPSSKTVTYGFKYGTLPQPARTGYSFSGWQQGEQPITGDTLVGPLGNHTLSAVWEALGIVISCDIVSHDEGNGRVSDSQVVPYGSEFTVEAQPYEGSQFLYWSDGVTLNPRRGIATVDTIYTAEFTSCYYRVEFRYRNAQGALTTTEPQTVRYGKSAEPPPDELVNKWPGHVFYGWRDDYQDIRANRVGDDAIEACYDTGVYYVRFNKNAPEATGEMADQMFVIDEAKRLSACQFRQEKKVFFGWSRHPDGAAQYDDQESVLGLSEENGAIVDLYAVWTSEPVYQIVYEPNGATNEPAYRQTLRYAVDETLTSNRFVRTGHTYLGWVKNATGKTADYIDGQLIAAGYPLAEPNAVLHLWAAWDPITYTLHFDANGGKSAIPDRLLAYDKPETIQYAPELLESPDGSSRLRFWAAEKDAKDGYRYVEGQGFAVSNLTAEAGATVTLYAIWEGLYTVEFDPGEGTGERYDQVLPVEAATALELNRFTRVGYTFVGWSREGSEEIISDGAAVTGLASKGGRVTLIAQWQPIEYTLHFDGNGAWRCDIPDRPLTYDKPETITYDAAALESPDNATLRFWATQKDAKDGYRYVEGEGFTVSNLTAEAGATVTLYAIWDDLYTVEFRANGGTGDPYRQTMPVSDYTALTSNRFARVGYTFNGWSREKNPETTLDNIPDGEKVVRLGRRGEKVMLYAQWKPIEYSVAFRPGVDEDPTMAPQTFKYDEAKALSRNAYVKAGFEFNGWQLGETIIFTDGQIVSNLTTEADATVPLVATWVKAIERYDVEFDPGDATGELYRQEGLPVGTPTALESNRFTRVGYIFAGWSREGSEEIIADGAKVTLGEKDKDVVRLTALWTPIEYTLHFNGNGAWRCDIPDRPLIYDTPETIQYAPELLEAPDSMRLKFWATQKDAKDGYRYVEGEGFTVSNLTTEGGATVTLYAIWEDLYQVEFRANGGLGDPHRQTLPVSDYTALTSNTFTRVGYTFVGWSREEHPETALDNIQDGASVVRLGKRGDIVKLYAQWQPIEYYVAFDANGGKGPTMALQTFKYGEAKALSGNQYTNGTSAFAGWQFGERRFADREVVSNLTATAGVTNTLKATWNDRYTVVFQPNGGTGKQPDQVMPVGTATALESNQFTRVGYTFAGWLRKGSGEIIADGAKVKLGQKDEVVTLIAQWQPITYSVAFHPNDGGGSQMASQNFKYDEAKALTSNTYVKEGFDFNGWQSNNGARFTNGQIVSNLTTEASATVTLYAIWKERPEQGKYTVVYDFNGGTNETGAISIKMSGTVGETFTVDPRCELYRWACSTNGEWKTTDGKVYTNGVEVANGFGATEGTTVTLLAQWKLADSYKTVTFDFNGGTSATGDGATSMVTTNQVGLTMDDPGQICTKEGFILRGWRKENGQKVNFKEEQITTNTTYKANWLTSYSDALKTDLLVYVVSNELTWTSGAPLWTTNGLQQGVSTKKGDPEGLLVVELPCDGELVVTASATQYETDSVICWTNIAEKVCVNSGDLELAQPGGTKENKLNVVAGRVEFSAKPDSSSPWVIHSMSWTPKKSQDEK